MKKIRLLAIAVIAVIAITSCDTKTCRCYYNDGVNEPYKDYEYVDEGTPCSSLDYERNHRFRMCTEMSEPEIDPHDIGQDYK